MPADPNLLHLAMAGGGAALGLACAIWALAERRAARATIRGLQAQGARASAAASLRLALLEDGRDAVLAWDARGTKQLCLHEADIALRACLDGPDGAALSAALEALHCDGTGFARAARDSDGRVFAIRGRVLGGAAAVWLEAERAEDIRARQFGGLLDALPVPIWLRDSGLKLNWANHAFLQAVGADSIESARARQAALDRSEPDFAAAALAEGRPRETGRYSLVRGVWRSFALTHVPLESGEVGGLALDISEATETEIRLKRQIHNQAHVLDRFKAAIAVFGSDRKLEAYNAAFVALWSLPRDWLDKGPTHDALLDRLRETRKLPERRDFQAWKRQRLALHGADDESLEETWPLPNGRTLRVGFRNNPQGGATVLYEDVTEKFALESSLNTLIAAQAATLDALNEAVAAFGPDGRLTLHNAAFAEMWEIRASLLTGQPHIRAVAAACLAKFGDEEMWDRLIATVSSSPSQRRDWRRIERGDGVALSLSTVPLPDRATLIVFCDVTHRAVIERASRERNEALETIDRLRTEYMKQLSYELRVPLNTVSGFAQQMMAEDRGTLSGLQGERIQAIAAGAEAMAAVVDSMLEGLTGLTRHAQTAPGDGLGAAPPTGERRKSRR